MRKFWLGAPMGGRSMLRANVLLNSLVAEPPVSTLAASTENSRKAAFFEAANTSLSKAVSPFAAAALW